MKSSYFKIKYRRIRYGKYHPSDCIQASFSAFNEFSNATMIKDYKNKDVKNIYSENLKSFPLMGQQMPCLKRERLNLKI